MDRNAETMYSKMVLAEGLGIDQDTSTSECRFADHTCSYNPYLFVISSICLAEIPYLTLEPTRPFSKTCKFHIMIG